MNIFLRYKFLNCWGLVFPEKSVCGKGRQCSQTNVEKEINEQKSLFTKACPTTQRDSPLSLTRSHSESTDFSCKAYSEIGSIADLNIKYFLQ